MGTGKTSVGKALSKKLGRELIDLDLRIEAKEKRKIREIFEKEGEAHFRALEKEMVSEIAGKENAVITTGGGAVLDPENITTLRKNGWIVALSARPETIFERVKNSQQRPLLKGGNLLAEIERLLDSRKPFYENCDFSFKTDDLLSSEVADHIIELLETETH